MQRNMACANAIDVKCTFSPLSTGLDMLMEPIIAAIGFNIQSNISSFIAPTYNKREMLSTAFINSHM